MRHAALEFIVLKISLKFGGWRVDISATVTIVALCLVPLAPELIQLIVRLARL